MGNSKPRKELPSRAEIEKKLLDLAEGRITRQDADRWAAQWVQAGDELAPVTDQAVWKALGHLFGAESKTGPTSYLHGKEDFQAWLEEFREAPPLRHHHP